MAANLYDKPVADGGSPPIWISCGPGLQREVPRGRALTTPAAAESAKRWATGRFFPSPELSLPFLGNSEKEPILVNLTMGAVWVYIYGYRYR